VASHLVPQRVYRAVRLIFAFRAKMFAEAPVMARKVSAVHFVGSVWKDRCSQPLTSESLARAEKAELDGTLSEQHGKFLCECGAHVGAHRTPPWMGGPMGSSLVPTSHSVHKSPRRSAPTKVYQAKRSQ